MKHRKINVKGWQLLLLLFLSIAIPMVVVVGMQKSEQVTCKGGHQTRKDYYQSARFSPPVSITSIAGNRMEWIFVEKGIEIGSLELEPGYSQIPAGFSKDNHADCYGIIYCDKHKVVLNIEKIPQTHCGTNKN